jgi:hypothetical protein
MPTYHLRFGKPLIEELPTPSNPDPDNFYLVHTQEDEPDVGEFFSFDEEPAGIDLTGTVRGTWRVYIPVENVVDGAATKHVVHLEKIAEAESDLHED